MIERNSLIRKEATRILPFSLTGWRGRFCEECCCQGHSVHEKGSLPPPLLGRTLRPVQEQGKPFVYPVQVSFCKYSLWQISQNGAGEKKSWGNWHCLRKCKFWAAVAAADTGSTISARAHHSQFLLDLQSHLCDQGTNILPNAKVLWYFSLQHVNLVSRKS